MPRSNDALITVNKTLHDQWKRVAAELGYGTRGKQKLLQRLLSYAEENQIQFELRK